MQLKRCTGGLLLIILLTSSCWRLSAQDAALPAIIPSSPEAYSLCQAGILSNSLFTGTATLSIPLYNLALKNYSLKVGLQYSSNGVKNSDLPTIVGMNFNLLAGGSIVRIIHDEADGSYENTPTNAFPDPWDHNSTLLDYLNDAADNYWDTEPDEYLFNINGMSGRFFVDSSGNGHCIPESNLQITVSGYDGDYKSFSIKTIDGTVYTFDGAAENTSSFQVAYAHDYSPYYRNETAWFLTNITTQTGEWINFYYTSKSITVTPGSYSVSYSSSGACGGNNCTLPSQSEYNKIDHDTYQLSYITSSIGVRIDVSYEQRPDYSVFGGYATHDYRATGLTVSEALSGTSHTLKDYVFKYSTTYFDMLGTARYYLDTLVNKAIDGSSLTQNYIFNYVQESNVPNRFWFYTFDAFGYNANSGTAYPVDYSRIDTAATRLYYQNKGYTDNGYSIPNPAYAPIGMLEKVTFPTGGYQKFYYEPNIISGGIIAGGERVSVIENYDPLSGISHKKYFKYTSLADTTASSGSSSFEPFYDYSYNYGFICGGVVYDCPSTMTSANTLTPYGSSSGTFVQYSSVIESDDGNLTNGGIEHTYQNEPDYTYGYGDVYLGTQYMPLPAHREAEINGAELKTVYFKKKNGALVTLKKVENTYDSDKRNETIINGYMDRRRYSWPYTGLPPAWYEFDGFDVIGYQFKSYKYNLTKTVTTLYDEKGQNPVLDSVLYDYADGVTWLSTKITHKGSDTATIVTYNTYPYQTDGSGVYASMQYLTPGLPIESKTYRQGNLIAAQKTEYNSGTYGVTPELIKTKLVPDTTNYKTRAHYYAFGSGGAVKEASKENGVHQVVIYGYTSDTSFADNLPIAEVMNASTSDVAYTSYEVNSKGGWTYSGSSQINPSSVTGERCYDLSGGNITKSISAGTTYLVTFWLKNNTGTATVNSSSATSIVSKNGWTLYTKSISASSTITISGTGNIDELRLYPLGAMMRTMTYRPFIGVSSECDVNNRITYYDYDAFGRLMLVRDEDKKVLKKNCYTYNGQTENCNVYGNVQKTGSYTRNNCSIGYTGTTLSYIVPANTYYATTQAAADAMAQTDADANGQDYANANGTCNP